MVECDDICILRDSNVSPQHLVSYNPIFPPNFASFFFLFLSLPFPSPLHLHGRSRSDRLLTLSIKDWLGHDPGISWSADEGRRREKEKSKNKKIEGVGGAGKISKMEVVSVYKESPFY